MSYPGAMAPPPGVVPDLNNPEDVLRTCNFVVQALAIAIVSAFVGTRFYVKMTILEFTLDDCAVLVAYVLLMGTCIGACLLGTYGGGLNQWEVSPDEILKYLKTTYALVVIYAPMVLSIKLALLALLVRIFGPVYHKTVIGIRVFIGMLCLYYVADFFASVFICWPISAFWSGGTPGGDCINMTALSTVDAILSVLTDVAILLIPIFMTWSLQMSPKKRLRVLGVLSAGGIAAAFSIYRLVVTFTLGQSENWTLANTKVTMAIVAEVSIGVICSCLPAVYALFLRSSRFSSRHEQHRRVNAHSQHWTVVKRSFNAKIWHREMRDGVKSGSGCSHQSESCMTSPQASRSIV